MHWWTLRQLKSKDRETRQRAVETLSNSGDVRAIQPLVAALSDWATRHGAAMGLTKLGWSPASHEEEVLFLLAKESWDALTKLAQRDVSILLESEAFQRELYDSFTHHRAKLIRICGSIRSERAISLIISALRVKGHNDSGIYESAVAAFVEIGSLGLPLLIEALKDHDACWASIAALGELRDNRAFQPLLEIFNSSTRSTRDVWSLSRYRDEAISSHIAVALAKIGDKRAIAPLLISLESVRSKHFKLEVAEALLKLGEMKAIDVLLSLIINIQGAGDHVEHRAVELLGRIGDPRAMDAIISALNNYHYSNGQEQSYQLRNTAAEALCCLWRPMKDTPEKRQLLREMLSHQHVGIRRAAAEELGNLGDTSAVYSLLSVLSEDNVSVYMAAAHALGKLGAVEAIIPLMGRLRLNGGSDNDKIYGIVLSLASERSSFIERIFKKLYEQIPDNVIYGRKDHAYKHLRDAVRITEEGCEFKITTREDRGGYRVTVQENPANYGTGYMERYEVEFWDPEIINGITTDLIKTNKLADD